MAQLSTAEIAVRRELVKETNLIANSYDRIRLAIRRTESEKQALKALKKLRINMETFERQNSHFGRQN